MDAGPRMRKCHWKFQPHANSRVSLFTKSFCTLQNHHATMRLSREYVKTSRKKVMHSTAKERHGVDAKARQRQAGSVGRSN